MKDVKILGKVRFAFLGIVVLLLGFGGCAMQKSYVGKLEPCRRLCDKVLCPSYDNCCNNCSYDLCLVTNEETLLLDGRFIKPQLTCESNVCEKPNCGSWQIGKEYKVWGFNNKRMNYTGFKKVITVKRIKIVE